MDTTQDENLTLEDLNSQMDRLRRLVKEQGQGLFKTALKSYFEDNPVVESIQFAGWVPYFNDGDVCEFSMEEYMTRVNDTCIDPYGDFEVMDCASERITTYDTAIGIWHDSPNPNYDPNISRAFKALDNLLGSCQDQTLQDMFGSNFVVRATPDSIEVEEYTEHE